MSSVATNLIQANTLVADPSQRLAAAFAHNSDGDPVSPLAASAVKFCSVGALIRQRFGTQPWDKTKSTKSNNDRCVKMVNAVLRSDEYDCLLQSCENWGFPSVAEMHDHASDTVFQLVWLGAISVARAQE